MKPRPIHLLPVLSLALTGCTLGPDFQLPSFGVGTSWKEAKVDGGVRLPDNWWRLYQDSELTRLVDRALAANSDLAAARARVETSRALVGVDRARMFPTLDFNGSAGIQRNSADATNDNLPPGFSIDLENQSFRGTFDLSYDPDLWGRNKRLLESSLSESAASQALLDSQRLGVAAEVCRQYFLLRGLDAQKKVLEDTIESRNSNYEIQKSKLDAGLIDGLTTSQAKTETELARNDLAVVERQRGAAEHALAVLCGTTPASFRV
ncbi:MAG: TolC family protein, partial [Verrucomicrobiae bacterium]|nr:TolC family protein [Verrucomicrobiae bacterium]